MTSPASRWRLRPFPPSALMSYCSGDAARMGAALTLCGEEEGGYAQ